MRILLLEFFSSGGIFIDSECERSPHERSTLVDEGWKMLQALLRDALRRDGLYIDVLLDESCDHTTEEALSHANVNCHPVANAEQFTQQLDDLAVTADYVIAIAPETDELLSQLAARLRKCGASVLLPSASQICWSSSKTQTCQMLTDYNIPTPGILSQKQLVSLNQDAFVVMKPDDGAGCVDTRVLTIAELSSVKPNSDMLIQPYQSGTDVSVSVIMGNNPVVMSPLYQQIKNVNQVLSFTGVEGDVAAEHAERATQLADRCIPLFPGARGWIGIDMVIGETPEDDMVIEINPRLTSSFCTLSEIADVSLVGMILDNATCHEST